MKARLRDDVLAWARGRHWQWRLPILLYLAWAGSRYARDEEYTSLFSGLTLGVHEAGHVLFGFLGETAGIAGGSLAQLLAPIAVAALLARQRDWFGVLVGTSWLAFSLWELARYVADASAQELPLVGFTDDPIHDWHWLLSRFGWLQHSATLAGLARTSALLILVASCALGAWLLHAMATRPAPAPDPITPT